jgi:phosphoribosylformylglycinamidine cyclo-ligase
LSELSYKDSGVDLDLYQKAMQRLPGLLARTNRPGVMEMPGGFGGLFRLGDAGKFEDPVLVSGSDGVGTKIKVAIHAQKFDTIGTDLVAMCSNDIACLGAQPLFFLDYIALGKDNPDLIVNLVEGVSAGCVQAGAALLGGETAIMPDLYAEGDLDMAGFCVGVVERSKILDGTKSIQPGDTIVGVASDGFHSNGYSLIRKAVFERGGLTVNDPAGDLGCTVAECLLTPTKIYNGFVNSLTETVPFEAFGSIAHITGGGLPENLERILPQDCVAKIDCAAWETPAAFSWVQGLGNVATDEMYRVFNMGIGMAVVVRPEVADKVLEVAKQHAIDSYVIGEVASGDRCVELANQ